MADALSNPIINSHNTRLRFERAATTLAIVVITLALAACFISMWPADWSKIVADRVIELKDAIFSFLETLGGFLGLSWGRGHLDNRLNQGT